MQVIPDKFLCEFLKVCKENDYDKLKYFINKFTLEAYSGLQMLEQLNDFIIGSDEFNNKQKAIIGEKLGVIRMDCVVIENLILFYL